VIRAVIDTNILVSGLISRKGNEALLILAVAQGWIRPCLSEAIIREYANVLARKKFSFPEDDIAGLINMLRDRGEMIAHGEFPPRSPDPGDTKFLHCALAARADFIVTGNKRHFPDSPYGSTRVIGAAELLDFLTGEIFP
jgi:putative PIN family toxin of toxin-antitoxin system